MANCAGCSRPLPEGARFCPFCGREVAATAHEERRVVTVLFADLVGYSGLSEHLDPERVKRLIDGAFERLVGDIVAFGGRVDKILGDGILALFGAPVAHEDDPDRAIRAALRMHDSLDAFVEQQPDLDARLQLRIGVNTGEVLVGTVVGTDDYTAMGDVVNVAARLQTLAPPGGTFIGDSTASLASARVRCEVVADLDVRGREQTERVWTVTGVEAAASASDVRSESPFVGRAGQCRLLDSIMAMVVQGKSAVVAVTGEAGAGKTRLVSEALARFPGPDVQLFAGTCPPYGEANPWAPIATALARRSAITAAPGSEQFRAEARRRVSEVYGVAETDPVLDRLTGALLHILDIPSEFDELQPAQARETLFSVTVEGLRRLSHTGPVVFWIDDLQWADPLLLDLLHRLSRSLADRPVLVITAHRDDTQLDWPPASDHPVTIRMPLEPLSRSEAETLLVSMLGEDLDPALAEQLFERSGGNPLFLTELARLACDQPDGGGLPGSLRALIAARLDRLDARHRAIIDNAAVLGTVGPLEALEHFAREMHQPYVRADIDVLVESGLLELDGPLWRFRSDVVREVAYHTLTKQVRAQRHAGTAAVMERTGVPADLAAHHAATAAELVREIGPTPGVPATIADRAVDLLAKAAQRALDVGAMGQAARHATRALDLGPREPADRRSLLLLRAEALAERREAGPARRDAEAALAAALEAADRRHEGIARRLLGAIEQLDGDLPAARHQLDSSVHLFREVGDDVELAASLRERGFVEVFGGPLDTAERLLDEAEALSERLGDRRGRAWVRQHLAWVAFLSGNTALAEERLQLAASEFEQLGDRAGRGWALGLLAYVRFFQRRFDDAEALANGVRTTAAELGDRWAPAMMDSLVAAIRLWTGRFADAEELSRRALESFRAIGDRFGMVQALGPRMRALVALGRDEEAKQSLEESLSVAEAYGDLSAPMIAAAGTAVHLGLGERAVVVAEQAVERTVAMGADSSEARVTLALALCQVGRPDDAMAQLLGVVTESPYVRAVRALAAAMTGDDRGAVVAADAVIADSGATYLDRVIADIAAAASELRAAADDEGSARLARASRTARDAGDAVATALVTCATTTLTGRSDDQDVEHLQPGWHRVIDALAGVEPRAGAVT